MQNGNVSFVQFCRLCNNIRVESGTPGLREKKRAETRATLEKAALDLVISDGLDGATIDAISERAFVSPRTFFNYFDSKEDAILGIRDVEITDDSLPQILDGVDQSDVVACIVRVLFHAMAPSVENFKLHTARKEVVQRYPQLLGRQMAQMFRMGKQLSEVAETIMRNDPAFASDDAAETSRFAEVLLTLCGSAVRSAARESAAAPDLIAPEDVEQRAVTLIREVIERLR
jgi:AcrR family transcriptional regulator